MSVSSVLDAETLPSGAEVGEPRLVPTNSAEFTRYMNLLVFLKDPRSQPIISRLNPKMCLTCWQIFSDFEKESHKPVPSGPKMIKHKITGTFQNMQVAKKESILMLSRQWKKVVGAGADEKVWTLQLTASLADHLDQARGGQKALPIQTTLTGMKRARSTLVQHEQQPLKSKAVEAAQPEPADQVDQEENQPKAMVDRAKSAAETHQVVAQAEPVKLSRQSKVPPLSELTVQPQLTIKTKCARRTLKTQQKDQGLLDKVLSQVAITEHPVTQSQMAATVKMSPASITELSTAQLSKAHESKGKEGVEAEKPSEGGQQQQLQPSGVPQLQDILAQDAQQVASKAQSLPSTVLLRPIEPFEPHQSTKDFQKQTTRTLQTILSRLDKIESRLEEKHFMLTSNGSISTQDAFSQILNQEDPARVAQQQQAQVRQVDSIQPLEAAADGNNRVRGSDETLSEYSDEQVDAPPNIAAGQGPTYLHEQQLMNLAPNALAAGQFQDQLAHELAIQQQSIAGKSQVKPRRPAEPITIELD